MVAELDSTGNHSLQNHLQIPRGWYTLSFRYAARKGQKDGNHMQVTVGEKVLLETVSADYEIYSYSDRVFVEEGDYLKFTGAGNSNKLGMTVTDILLTREHGSLDDNEDDFFAEFNDIPGTVQGDDYSEENFDLEDHPLMDSKDSAESRTIVTTFHAPWFAKHEIDPEQILINASWTMDNHTEEFVQTVYSSILKKTLEVYATKADQWCFVRVGSKGTDSFTFFFECVKLLESKAFFREMNKDCPYP